MRLHATLLFPAAYLTATADDVVAPAIALVDERWTFTVAFEGAAAQGLTISLPARDKSLLQDVQALCVAAKLLLCQLAFAYTFDEPVLVMGATSFKSHAIALFARMVDMNKPRQAGAGKTSPSTPPAD